MHRKQFLLFYLFFLSIYILITGGRIPSSDGMTMFYVTQGIVERGELSVPSGNATLGPDGKLYSKYGIGQSLVALPFYLLGKGASALAPEKLQDLLIRSVVSLTNAFIGAAACLAFFLLAIRLGLSPGVGFWLTISFGVASFFIPYTKSFLSEPLQTLCLLLAVYGVFRFNQVEKPSLLIMAGSFCGLGMITKPAFIINVFILGIYFLAIWWSQKKDENKWRQLFYFGLPVVVGLLVVLWYNFARYGGIFETGYGQEATMAGFSTPLYVGLYGLLLSSGKGFFWFTPVAILEFACLSKFSQQHRSEAILFVGLFVINVLFYAQFNSWAGDGSWGGRYMVPVIPFVLLPIGVLLQTGQRNIKRWFGILLITGILVQIAGVSIYFGTYVRAIGEYPYQRSFTDPEFLYKSRYIPNYSQIIGQWRMLVRNSKLFFAGEKIELTPTNNDSRIPLTEKQSEQLFYALDYWFAYASYIGVNKYILILGVLVLGMSTSACYILIPKDMKMIPNYIHHRV